MIVSVILAHPDAGSFNAALAEASCEQLRALGHTVHFHDLYREGFNPLLPAAELTAKGCQAEELQPYCGEIAQSDGIVIVHPNWWGQPPAILKGWVDRVLCQGVAYRFLEGDGGEGIPVGLLKAHTAVVFNTSNTPREREQAVFGDPLDALWRKCIFEFCGVGHVVRAMFGVVVTSTVEQRTAWLEQARRLLRDNFGRA